MLPKLNILYEDNDILVCVKPAGIPCESDNGRSPDLLNIIKNYLSESTRKSGNNFIPYAALLHRLDRFVGGVMVFAKNRNAAARLSNDIREKSMGKDVLFEKEYMAVLAGTGTILDDTASKSPSWHTLHDYIKTDKKSNTSFITSKEAAGAKPAELSYRILKSRSVFIQSLSDKELSLYFVQIKLKTGRHHQIRLQMQSHLSGIWGDRKYNPLFNSTVDFRKLQAEYGKSFTDLALFSSKLSFLQPVTGEKLCFEAKPDFPVISIFFPE